MDPPSRLVLGRQRHSLRIRAASDVELDPADGLLTSMSRQALGIYTADCVPVLLAAPAAVAALHAGWRGLAGGLVGAGVAALCKEGSWNREQLVAWIGPCMSACCYQVAEEVAVEVASAGAPEAIWPRSPRPHLDLAGVARTQLAAAGVEDIRLLSCCTGCHSDDWWSHRREEGRAGRNYAFIWQSPDTPGSRAPGREGSGFSPADAAREPGPLP